MKSKQPKQAFEPAQAVAAHLGKRAEVHGLICRSLFADRVAVCPPLIITEAEIDEMLRRLGLALDDTDAMVREKGLLAA